MQPIDKTNKKLRLARSQDEIIKEKFERIMVQNKGRYRLKSYGSKYERLEDLKTLEVTNFNLGKLKRRVMRRKDSEKLIKIESNSSGGGSSHHRPLSLSSNRSRSSSTSKIQKLKTIAQIY